MEGRAIMDLNYEWYFKILSKLQVQFERIFKYDE